ncbi:MAG: ATP-binding protein [Thermodesulfovibrionales bacterium]|nr:ATP-binding protein [Thermodesulfovibrionales bacterium]
MTNDQTIEDILSILTKLYHLASTKEQENKIDLSETVALLWNGKTRSFRPIKKPVKIDIDNLLNIDYQKKKLLANTTNFIKGKSANNVLLWGEKGTGKSSLIKGLIKKFSSVGLRMIQVFNQDILTIHYIYDFVCKHSYYRFIIFIDDLSFDEEQREYKALKTILDGGLEEIPENILFYATSNRRHLIPTRFSDRDDDIVRPSDNLEEKISLVDRFGLRLGFYRFDEESYLKIVDLYASKSNIRMEKNKLHLLAKQWALEAGGRNGRVAEQFIKDLF